MHTHTHTHTRVWQGYGLPGSRSTMDVRGVWKWKRPRGKKSRREFTRWKVWTHAHTDCGQRQDSTWHPLTSRIWSPARDRARDDYFWGQKTRHIYIYIYTCIYIIYICIYVYGYIYIYIYISIYTYDRPSPVPQLPFLGRRRTRDLRKHAASAPAEFGGADKNSNKCLAKSSPKAGQCLTNVSISRGLPMSREIEPVCRSFRRRRTCMFTQVGRLLPSGFLDSSAGRVPLVWAAETGHFGWHYLSNAACLIQASFALCDSCCVNESKTIIICYMIPHFWRNHVSTSSVGQVIPPWHWRFRGRRNPGDPQVRRQLWWYQTLLYHMIWHHDRRYSCIISTVL